MASLGHVEDESVLVTMRARYYEPTSGSFISEDPARDGVNWFAYCGNEPVGRADRSGQNYEELYPVFHNMTPEFERGLLQAYAEGRAAFIEFLEANWRTAAMSLSVGRPAVSGKYAIRFHIHNIGLPQLLEWGVLEVESEIGGIDCLTREIEQIGSLIEASEGEKMIRVQSGGFL